MKNEARDGGDRPAPRGPPGPRRTAAAITLTGTVQGVGFRPFVYRLAHDAGVAGRVRNDAAGVTIEAFGTGGGARRVRRRGSGRTGRRRR